MGTNNSPLTGDSRCGRKSWRRHESCLRLCEERSWRRTSVHRDRTRVSGWEPRGTISSLIKLWSQSSPMTTWISSGEDKLPVVEDMHVEIKWPLGQDFEGMGCTWIAPGHCTLRYYWYPHLHLHLWLTQVLEECKGWCNIEGILWHWDFVNLCIAKHWHSWWQSRL